jgi:YfiH family protein
MELLQSPLLAAFAHGFTTRGGGVSAAPYDRLNLGGAVGDDPACVVENWRRLEDRTGLRFARVRQVHGVRVVRAGPPCEPAEEADAVLSAAAGVAACVSVADCVPILLADPETGAVAAIHAGWRGTLAGAAAEGVAAMAREFAAPADRLLAAIGPSIGPCCYEVSDDVAAPFGERFGSAVVRGPLPGPAGKGGPHLDLWAANHLALVRAGVRPERLHLLSACTSCAPDRFFSHRRDRGRTGRHVAFIAPRAPTRGGGVP